MSSGKRWDLVHFGELGKYGIGTFWAGGKYRFGPSSGGGKYRNTGRALSGIGIDNILGDLPFGET